MEDVAGGEKPRRGEDCWQYGCTNRLDCPEPTEDECPDDDCWNGSPATKNISGSNAEKEGRGYGCSWVRQIKDGQYGGPFSYDGYSGCQTADFTNCPYKYEPSGSGNIGIGSTLAQRGSLNWRIAYANTNYPWILQSHRMSKNTRFFDAGGERINRFKIDGPPGEYILHVRCMHCCFVLFLVTSSSSSLPHSLPPPSSHLLRSLNGEATPTASTLLLCQIPSPFQETDATLRPSRWCQDHLRVPIMVVKTIAHGRAAIYPTSASMS